MLFSDEEEKYHLLVCSFISCYYIYYMPDIMLKIQGEEKQKEKKTQTNRFPLIIIWNITLFWKIDLQTNQWSESYNQSTGETQSLNSTWEKGFLEREVTFGEKMVKDNS